MHLNTFEFNFDGFNTKGDKYSDNCNTVVLHGAGNSSRKRFEKLRNSLNKKGLPSMCFDFIGHGETEGKMSNSSLKKRFEQAQTAIKQHAPNSSTLIGSSMSGYTAIKLTEIFPIENLILMIPGVYTPQAYNLDFGPDFSKVIRIQNSWVDSDAFSILEKFNGNLLIIAAQNDSVIPTEVLEKIYNSATSANTKKLHIIPNAEHSNLFPLEYDFNLDFILCFIYTNRLKCNFAVRFDLC